MTVRLASSLGIAWLASLVIACGIEAPAPSGESCQVLFGRPNARTGLDSSQCQPRCSCGGRDFEAPTFDEASLVWLDEGWVLSTPYEPIEADPYASPAPTVEPDSVCAVVAGPEPATGPRPYELVDFATESAARDAGAVPTHFGRCGVCSTLANLAVYIREEDLTDPVRACGLSAKDRAEHLDCLEALGFDRPCADIWYWNTSHTKSVCLEPCLAALGAPYHDEAGALNECLACDERESGDVFKALAGRTRRNSGLANAMCRPCSEVRPLAHDYPRSGS